MDLHLVTYFVAVVDHGGITKAAQSLYISQPSLSQAIRTLERRLGVTLFDRTGRRLELTDAGRKLDDAARRILADVDRAKAKVEAVRELRAGRVDIVTHAAFSIDPMVAMIRGFRERFPRLAARVVAADGPSGVLAALRRGDAEIGLMDAGADHATFTAIPLGEQELVLTVPAPLATNLTDPVPRASVKAVPLILDLGDPGASSILGDLIDDDGRNVVVDCAHPAAAWDLVGRGTGATIAPRVVAEEQMPEALRHRLDPPLRRPFGLVVRSGRPSPAAMAFIAVAKGHVGVTTDPTDFGEW
ncbi:LysR family transcriptional regulator [Gordonia sp. ABSL11-1]|uniref:LysR family transcriptional regulator n=1 Tax=Gordonia sp. ABSL11-1 TaxID=3053924 RepID=UPI0025731A4F|nr:LysR family transcriptional regulator [Gordonia sp. ABSL11-1]MDL9945592.1 LysR family transcriptional regulator [Gordonia sp. ABSL11-1]